MFEVSCRLPHLLSIYAHGSLFSSLTAEEGILTAILVAEVLLPSESPNRFVYCSAEAYHQYHFAAIYDIFYCQCLF